MIKWSISKRASAEQERERKSIIKKSMKEWVFIVVFEWRLCFEGLPGQAEENETNDETHN